LTTFHYFGYMLIWSFTIVDRKRLKVKLTLSYW